MQYEIAWQTTLPALRETVVGALEDGWEPLGGVTTGPDVNLDGSPSGQFIFIQALVKRL